jgi:hypothetical protein
MNVRVADVSSRFSDRILRFQRRVDFRVARTADEKEAVYRLRYEAYIHNGLIEPRDDQRLYDSHYDDALNTFITTTFIDGELASTTRVSVGRDVNAVFPAYTVYPDLIAPLLRDGRVVVESARTAARFDLAGHFPELPYATMRPAYLAAEHFDADYAAATARADHVAFFRRVFCMTPWCEPREYPNFTAKVACLVADTRLVQDQIEMRYPFLRSSAAEREALFGPAPNPPRVRARPLRPIEPERVDVL